VTTESHRDLARAFRDAGFHGELRATFALGDEPWGLWCSLRERSSRAFGERELAFFRRIAPHVARGIRTAALREAASSVHREEPIGDAPVPRPGVIVIDDRGRVVQRTDAATRYVIDLSDPAAPQTELPPPVLGVMAMQRMAGQHGPTRGNVLRVRGRSGRWYTIQGALTEPDAEGRSSRIVIIAPLGRAEVAPLLARLYGLSAREREVTALVARGYSSKEIAHRLGISPYTVQDHLDHAAEKVGVRGRRALLAKLFFDGHARHLHGRSAAAKST
jgi:DNA-binding CsgD family transcriptional regulator